jgi:diguanylate cyclase
LVEIIKDLFVNLVIIIAALTLGNLIVRDRVPNVTKKNEVAFAILCGILGCLLMIYSVKVSPSVIVDYRCIPIVIMGIYCSITAATITALVIGAFRIAYTGISMISITAVIIAISMGLLCGFIGKLKISIKAKWILSFFAVSLVTGVGFFLVINDLKILNDILPVYYIGLLIVSTVTYYIKTYNLKSNDIYHSIKRDSNIDFLTGLHNVRYFDKSFNISITDANKKHQSISLLFIDVDFFKKVNDVYGHLNGDKVLKEISEILLKLSRENDVVTRKGGEEFTVLLSNCSLKEAKQVAERIRSEIENYSFISLNKETIKITVSIGVSAFPETTKNAEDLTEQADIALYKAKRDGRNRVCVANEV